MANMGLYLSAATRKVLLTCLRRSRGCLSLLVSPDWPPTPGGLQKHSGQLCAFELQEIINVTLLSPPGFHGQQVRALPKKAG